MLKMLQYVGAQLTDMSSEKDIALPGFAVPVKKKSLSLDFSRNAKLEWLFSLQQVDRLRNVTTGVCM